jgi:2-polyprenyl-3-methyl-5-hydroxy-6-metoxy-1,4-benzoquinol methylase
MSTVPAATSARIDPSLREAHALEIDEGQRFAFGKNWARFLEVLTDERIAEAEQSLRQMLGVEDLHGRRFLDVGSGSGLFSLAARRLGAEVHSFDYDADSVGCTAELRRRYDGAAAGWTVEHGSVLDEAYLRTLGRFDIVYSWGVLHHTGAMWRAIENVLPLVAPNGQLFIALYNDQGPWSKRWHAIKRTYCSGPLGRALVSATVIPFWVVRDLASDLVWLRNPARRYTEYVHGRGMSVTRDWFDWLGGFPFEVAKPEQVFDFLLRHGFRVERLTTAGGSMGCNEFVARRVD